jgi:hypothetical protein
MFYSPKITFVADGNNLTDVGLTPTKIICFGSLEFTTNRFSNLSLSPKGNDSGTVLIGMVHSGSPSMHTILEESSDECDTTSVRGGSSRFPDPRGCNVVTPTVPITTGEHLGTSDHTDGPVTDRHAATRHWAPS